MDFILGLLVAVKSLAFMEGIVPSERATVTFAEARLSVAGERVRFSCSLASAFPGDLKKLAQSGTAIPLYVFADIRLADGDSAVASCAAGNSVVFDLVDNTYRVRKSQRPDTLATPSLDSALAALCVFNDIPLATTGRIVPGKSYYITASAVLGKTTIEALRNNTIDLMYFWNYRRPSVRMEPFDGKEIIKAR